MESKALGTTARIHAQAVPERFDPAADAQYARGYREPDEYDDEEIDAIVNGSVDPRDKY